MAQMPDGDPAPLNGLLPESAAEGLSQRTLHAYLHIPFCRVRCGYCDYNTYTSSELQGETQNSFLDNLLREISFSKNVLQQLSSRHRKFSTVFFGGGTPTQLASEQLAMVLETLRNEFGIEENAEVTTEANPDTVDERYLNTLADAGFTRVSIGMQSSVASVLKTLDRTHNPENVAKAVAAAKSAGLQVSVDLIYGTPGESLDDWRESLSTAIGLEPNHISAYSLIVEPGTKTGVQLLVDNPKEIGADRIVNTLAAHTLYGGPAIVVDFGTSTNLDVVSPKGEFLGGALAPGIEISVDALAARAAQLRKVELVRPKSVIGKNTVEALQSGTIFGFAGQVDGLVDRITAELAKDYDDAPTVIATGGLAPLIIGVSETIDEHEPDLTLIGLRLIHEKNQ